jgi:hypothetical protein
MGTVMIQLNMATATIMTRLLSCTGGMLRFWELSAV